MRIHRVELEHVRQIKRAVLEFSHSLSIVGGRNGVGKTAVQEAILTAMFDRKKEERESLISRFDADSLPTATLHLSRGEAEPTIRLQRILTDKAGQWSEGASHIKAKGEALKKVQESLPMSAEAAALLLWGRQNDLAAVVREFPADGHSLLTAATIKGAGPDPKLVIENLEDQIKQSKRGGQNPGPLTRAQQRLKALEAELAEAQQSLSQLGRLHEQYRDAKAARDQLSRERQQAEREVREMERLQTALETALTAQDEADRLEKQRTEWEGLDDELRRRQRALADLREELKQLQSQHRVALDASLADQADRLQIRMRLAGEADAKLRELRGDLESRARPDARELKLLDQHQKQQSDALNRLDATGLRYELSTVAEPRIVELSEDNSPARQVTLAPNQTQENIVGSVVIRADGLRVVAKGKEDVSSLKRAAERADREIAEILARYGASDEHAFRRLADQRNRLADACSRAEMDLNKHLGQDTLESLRAELASLEKRRAANRVTTEDREAWSHTVLAPVTQIEKLLYGKQVELDKESKAIKQLETRRPTDAQQQQLQTELRQRRGAAQAAAEVFAEQSPGSPSLSKQLRETIRGRLAMGRMSLDELHQKQRQADVQVERLSGDLKHSGPKRPLGSVELELEDARADLQREETLQKARELLKARIAEKIQEMSESVPRELGSRIGQHLARLTGGAYAQVSLSDSFSVDNVGEGGERPERWQPHQLSAGEQALTALVMKIAVARALAESGNPVFILLDDSLVNLDPQYRAATEALLLDLVADGKLQVILLTCHTDWAADWQTRSGDKLQYIDLARQVEYYRSPPMLGI